MIVTLTLAVLPVAERWARAPSLRTTAGVVVWAGAGACITPRASPVAMSAVIPLLRIRFMPGNLPGWPPLLPFDGARRLRGDVEGHPVDARHLVDQAARHALEHLVGQPGPVGGHRVLAGDGADHDRVGVRALVAHDAHAAHRREHGEALPELPVEPGPLDLLDDHGVGPAQDLEALGRDRADDAHREARAGNGWRQTISSGRPSSSPITRTSSLNRLRSGSTSSNCMSSGRPPTLWWDLILAASLVPDSMMSG